MSNTPFRFKISHLIFIFIVGAFLLPSLILSAFVLKTQTVEQRLKELASDQVVTTIAEQVLSVETGLYAGLVRFAFDHARRGAGVSLDDLGNGELLVAGQRKADGKVEIFFNKDPDAPYLATDSVLAALGPLADQGATAPGDRLYLGVKTGVSPAYFRKFNLISTPYAGGVLFGIVDNMALSNQLATALEPLGNGGEVAVVSPEGELIYAPERIRYRVESLQYEAHTPAKLDPRLADDYSIRTTTITKHAPGTSVLHLTETVTANVEVTRTVLVIIFSMVLSLILGVIAAQSIRGSIAMPIERLSDTFRRTGVGEPSEESYKELLGGLATVRDAKTNVAEIADLLHGTAGLAERLTEYQTKMLENAKYQAVGLATQMLAHDVRKPFSKLRIGLSSLKAANSWEATQAVAARLTHEVERSLVSVQGMLEDIMEASALVVPSLEVGSPIQLIDSSLRETVMVSQAHGITFRYDMRHTRAVLVAPLKVARLLHNIIDNALHATSESGLIWIESNDEVEESGRTFVEFCIGNAGSFIEPADRENVFKAFFTKGKSRGTGLGLPIARKIVEGHGGRIWCSSSHDRGTEFHFTLQAAEGPETHAVSDLPETSNAVLQDQPRRERRSSVRNRDSDKRLASAAAEVLASFARKVKVLIVDDDASYGKQIQELMMRSDVGTSLDVSLVTDGFKAIAARDEHRADIILCDLDFGLDDYSGFDLIRELNQLTPRPFLCVHSNRVLASDARSAYDAGADIFLRKPLTDSSLSDLFGAMRATQKAKLPAKSSLSSSVPKDVSIAVIDDDPFVCEAWIETLSPMAHVRSFLSPEAFLSVWHRREEWDKPLVCIITDFYFEETSNFDGYSLTLELLKNGCSVPVVLSSDAKIDAEMAKTFRAVIRKVPLSLMSLLEQAGKSA